MRHHLLLAPLTVAALAAAGCGSSDSASTGSAASAPPAASSSAPAALPSSSGATVAIGMMGIQFAPKDVTVKVGQTIKWTDLEIIEHNVTADSGATFKSATFGKGKSFSFKPTKAGTIKYECTIHPGMVGTITVEG